MYHYNDTIATNIAYMCLFAPSITSGNTYDEMAEGFSVGFSPRVIPKSPEDWYTASHSHRQGFTLGFAKNHFIICLNKIKCFIYDYLLEILWLYGKQMLQKTSEVGKN